MLNNNAKQAILIMNFVRNHPAFDNEQIRAIKQVLEQVEMAQLPFVTVADSTLKTVVDDALEWLRTYELEHI